MSKYIKSFLLAFLVLFSSSHIISSDKTSQDFSTEILLSSFGFFITGYAILKGIITLNNCINKLSKHINTKSDSTNITIESINSEYSMKPKRDREGKYLNTDQDSCKDLENAINADFKHTGCLNQKEVMAWQEDNPQVVGMSKPGKITWLGHSSFLIQIGNINIVTDPVFGDLSDSINRSCPCPIDFSPTNPYAPTIDYVIISHDHIDHLDKESLMDLKKVYSHYDYYTGTTQTLEKPYIICPEGLKRKIKDWGFRNVEELTWWDHLQVNAHQELDSSGWSYINLPDIKFTFLPAKHCCHSTSGEINESLWGSWMIECEGKQIYFAGDSGSGDHFKEIGNQFTNINVALMPIGPNEPSEIMRNAYYLSTTESIDAFKQLGAQNFIPMHWGTFNIGNDSFMGPINTLKSNWDLDSNHLHLLKFGGTYHL